MFATTSSENTSAQDHLQHNGYQPRKWQQTSWPNPSNPFYITSTALHLDLHVLPHNFSLNYSTYYILFPHSLSSPSPLSHTNALMGVCWTYCPLGQRSHTSFGHMIIATPLYTSHLLFPLLSCSFLHTDTEEWVFFFFTLSSHTLPILYSLCDLS